MLTNFSSIAVEGKKQLTCCSEQEINQQAHLWLSKLDVDISIWWAESVLPGWNRVKVDSKTLCGHIPHANRRA